MHLIQGTSQIQNSLAEDDSQTIGLVILAAGASRRMGTPKQLLLYQEQSFLRHLAEVAIASVCRPIVVVVGAYSERVRQEVSQLPVQVVENLQWTEGMGSSIRTGLQTLVVLSQNIEAVVLLLCDQPFVSLQIIDRLVDSYYTTGKPIIASEYAQTLGVPALFSHTLFSELMRLKDAEGAKRIIMKYSNDVLRILFPEGVFDIDTLKDYEQFRTAMAQRENQNDKTDK